MAHKKGVGSTDNGRDSNPKYLGVKLFGSQYAKAGNIIVRQRGTKYHPGENVYMGRDHTLHAKIEGHVSFTKRRGGKTFVHIIPLDSDGGAAVKSQKARKNEAKPKAPKAVAKAANPAKANSGNGGGDNGSGNAEPKTTVHRMSMEEYNAMKAKEAAAKGAAGAAAGGAAAGAGAGADKKAQGTKPDKLTKIEGVGPKISEHLGAAGIITFADLAGAPISKLQEILTNAGPRFKMHKPDTWPQQAQLAADGKWDELDKLQDALDGGRVVKNSGEEE